MKNKCFFIAAEENDRSRFLYVVSVLEILILVTVIILFHNSPIYDRDQKSLHVLRTMKVCRMIVKIIKVAESFCFTSKSKKRYALQQKIDNL